MGNTWTLTPSPDGKQAYTSGWFGEAVRIFDRDPTTGRVTPRTGAANCYKQTPSAGDCTQVKGMAEPLDVLVTPNGKFVYVVGWGSSTGTASVAAFSRNATTGRLTQLPGTKACIGAAAGCTPGIAMDRGLNLYMSPDGHNIYETAQTANGAIAILTVNPDGSLSQLPGIDGCVTPGGDDGNGHPNTCTPGTAVGLSYQLAITPDGKFLYDVSQSDSAVTVFQRDTTSGALTQKNGVFGCISQSGNSGACTPEPHLGSNRSVMISRDSTGKLVYALGGSTIVQFTRNTNGTLTFKQCWSETGTDGCLDANGVSDLQSGAISPDGKLLVAKNDDSGGTGGISFFNIDQTTGLLTQRPGTAGCATQNGSTFSGGGQCAVVPALGGEGTVKFASNLLLNYGGFQNGSAVVFDRDFRPTCAGGSVGVPFNTATLVGLNCSDVNHDALSFHITQAPGAGLLGAIDTPNKRLFYNPFLGFTGDDLFKFTATARGVTSAPAQITLHVAGPGGGGGGGAVDADRDGYPAGIDCDDSNANIHPNAHEVRGNNTDENCDGKALPFLDLNSTVLPTWSVAGAKTTAAAFQLKNLKKGWKVQLSCKGKGCPFKTKKIKNKKVKKGSFNAVKKFGSKRTFRAGSTLTVKFTAPRFNTKFSIFKFKTSPHLPKGTARCQTRGKRKLRACH
jgi:hypothetical protein